MNVNLHRIQNLGTLAIWGDVRKSVLMDAALNGALEWINSLGGFNRSIVRKTAAQKSAAKRVVKVLGF
ncbi:MAG: hypothetical protein JWP25_2249 [Bradyrhizobium sp.]|jgi:hypothetical protein|nr:hypothetical protein [Bradyrhizobium sp.]